MDSYEPHYNHILTKKGDHVNTFKYNAIPSHIMALIPKETNLLISLKKYKHISVLADINPYFSMVDLGRDTLSDFGRKYRSLIFIQY